MQPLLSQYLARSPSPQHTEVKFMTYTSSVPLYWRLRKSKYNLIGTKCTNCNSVFFPPRALCPNCRRRGKTESFKFSGNGKILTYTIIRAPPEGFEMDAPYGVAIVRLDEGTNVTGQIVGDINKIEIGNRVKMVFRKICEDGEDGLIRYGFKFQLAGDGAGKG